ncbi:MAG: methyltransferase domain-containing protein [Thaumarchaeota archaeon]|nr:methyltransferase domain-containing protein [Nitrososphaerota archaeon]
MSQSFFILSGEHQDLAKDELVSVSKSYDIKALYRVDSRLVIITSSTPWKKIAKRATFVRAAGNLAGTFKDISKIEFPKSYTFACRAINLSSKKINTLAIEKETGAILKQKLGCRVSLLDPTLTVYLVITDNNRYVGYADALEYKRSTKEIKYPTELDWKLGRCMVNLSRLKEGRTLCDPFCGTGTILLEAKSMGIRCIGIDFDSKMCEISRKNLTANGYKAGVINSTYHHISKIKDKIDAIVTDVPYGTASRSSMSPKKVIQDFVSVVPKKMKLVLVYKKGMDVDGLAKAKKYEIYRHKSLTRVIAIR